MTRRAPAHVRRVLAVDEAVCHLTRPRRVALRMLLFFGSVILALAVVSILIEDPGFMRLASLPSLPLLGGLTANLLLDPVVAVTGRGVIVARRFEKPLVVPFERLAFLRCGGGDWVRRLGYGDVDLYVTPPQAVREGVFLLFELERIPDADRLVAAILAAADARGVRVALRETTPGGKRQA